MIDVTMEYFPHIREAVIREPGRKDVRIKDVSEEDAIRHARSMGLTGPIGQPETRTVST